MGINDVSRVPHMPDVTRVTPQTQVPVAPRYNTNQQGQALFSASESYRNQQLEIKSLLETYGFNAEQAFKLAQIGNLPIKQFARSVILAQMLLKEAQLFENFAKTLKQLVNRGHNVQQGVRTFLDGLDKLLGEDTRKLAEKIIQHHAETPDAVESVAQKNYSHHSKHQDSKSFEHNLSKDLNLKLLKTLAPSLITPKSAADFQKYLNFFETSMEEFPTRFQIDVFAQGELAQKGLSLENYIKLASEVPPLRLINLLSHAEKQGHAPQMILNTLIAAQENGENLLEVLTTLEHQFLPHATLPVKPDLPIHAPLGFVMTPQTKEVPLTSPIFTMKEGEDFVLKFVALDGLEGLVEPEKTGFVIFPQQNEQAGRELNLSQLPVGVYYIMLAGLTPKNKMMNLWLKVIVEEKSRNAFEKEDDETQEEDSGFEQNQEKRKNLLQNSPPDLSEADAIKTTFTPPSFQGGRFLGEIILPLDLMQQNPDELLVVTDENGVVISEQEYQSGTFAHNAVTFRFLTHYMDMTDFRKRHELLHLRESTLFKDFDAEVKSFSQNPKSSLENFKSGLGVFFKRLKGLFPAGEQTFEVAKNVFEKEAENFANGETGGELYQVKGFEGDGKKFIASCYAKGGYALASSGDVSGALHGMACATLVDLEDAAHQAALGEYLENLKSLYYSKMTPESMQNYYSTHLGHAFGQTITTSPYYADLGKRFVKAVALLPPAASEPPKPHNPYVK